MNKRELKRMRRSFEKGRDALLEYAELVKPENGDKQTELIDAAVEAIKSLEKLGEQEFTFVMATIGATVCTSSIIGVGRAMRSMEEEKKK